MAWPFLLVFSAVMLFEVLPAMFTFDDLTREGERQGLSMDCKLHIACM